MLEYNDSTVKKLMTKWKMENGSLTEPQMKYYMGEFEKYSKNPVFTKGPDITQYTFHDIEHIIDAHFPKKNGVGKFDMTNKHSYQDDVILDNDELLIVKGDGRDKCIKYGKGESWCISRVDTSNMYTTYRLRMGSPAFYFVIDKQLPETAPNKKIVVMVNENGGYSIADRGNGNDVGFGGNSGSDIVKWDYIIKIQPKLSNYQSLFEKHPLSQKERDLYQKIENEVSDETFKNFTFDEKEAYIGYPHHLTVGQLDILDKISNGKSLIRKYAISTIGVNLTQEIQNKHLTPSDKNVLIENVLQYLQVENYTIDNNGIVDVHDDVYIEDVIYTTLPIRFGKVDGNFSCSYNEYLTSLVGVPPFVRRSVSYERNSSLQSLKGGVQYCGGSFMCNINSSLISLEGAPHTIGHNIQCNDNKVLKSLTGLPMSVNGDFTCDDNNSLASLIGGPLYVDGNFSCNNNVSLLSLRGAPEYIRFNFYCNGNGFAVSEEYLRDISDIDGRAFTLGSDV